jgi:hypothetical protein
MKSESEIKKEITDYLKVLPGCYARVVQVKSIKGRRSPSKGILDIMVCYWGLGIAIEVKTPTGHLEDSQKDFIEGWKNRGYGVAVVVTSLQEVIDLMHALLGHPLARVIRAMSEAPSIAGP